jgi:hypothetical protein
MLIDGRHYPPRFPRTFATVAIQALDGVRDHLRMILRRDAYVLSAQMSTAALLA